ncbi:MAG: sigma-70 family RNA polymerase sigma factor, partial [Solirubrobacteraceae bacterium]
MEAKGNAGIALAQRGDGPSDHELVGRVRRGDDRAFELLYQRYQRRIGAFVLGMVKDHGRAEDVTQEVFVAALRRMRATERPIAFKPWIYEIARNACIDAYRRSRRGEEVSYDGGDRLSPADHTRLVAGGLEPPAAAAARQELDTVLGAFGGLSDAHHEILVLRELEGMSYADIGERMGMSRAGVESTLFRARKRLGEEYDELASGARCVRVQGIIAADGNDKLGARDARRLARHVAHCQPCRRLALAAGLEVPARRGLGGRIAAWLPLPGFLRFGGWGTQRVAELLEPGWGKLAAGAAALLLAGA